MTRPLRRSFALTLGLAVMGGALSVVAVALASARAADALADLGVTEGRAKEAVFDSFMAGTVSIAGNPAVFTAASPQARVAFVMAATTLARSYVDSDEFIRRYADHREANAPDPLPPERTADDILAKQRADFEGQVAGVRAQFAEITPEQRTTLERGFDEMRARFDKMERGEEKVNLARALSVQRAQQAQAHENAVQVWELDYPDDPQRLVAMRLRRFLEMTRDMDFSAKLVERDRKMRFADSALERRPVEWKMCFRAGKAATGAARVIAQDWLASLEAKGVKLPPGQAP